MPWQPYRTYAEKARYIIEHNNYMIVATSDKKGNPWAAPVFFAYDDKYNFYFLSAVDSKHAENIVENPKVCLVIFDSSAPVGQSDGVQIDAKASFVPRKEVTKVINIYCDRLFPDSNISATERYDPNEYVEPAEFRFLKVEVVQAYTTGIDRRVDVDLKDREGSPA
jgi:nitroimidazol reductase NimA-like FMN-containing flavoprotein (pyridoxamine 5'-phosphate oxidase superfamily)